MKEFIVTLWNRKDLDQFYQEMENSGECNNIPHRPVECCNRRKISRNTHYFLSEDEAAALLQDERVRDVSLTTEELGIKAVLISGITNKRDDDFIIGESNWGLDTHINGVNGINNGADKHYRIANSYDYNTGFFHVDRDIQGSFLEQNCFSLFDDTVTNKGKNVDVVIVDGDVDGQHIEFRKNTSKLISDTVRLPKKIVVSGLMFPTGKVLNLTFRDDAFHQSNLTNFYIDEDVNIGIEDTVDSIRLISEPVIGNNYARNTDGLSELKLVLKSGTYELATKVVPKPSILDEGYSYNFHYACPLKTFGGQFMHNPSRDEFLSGGYTGNGLMSSTNTALALGYSDANGYSILKHESAETIDHQIIPAYSDYQNPSNENYVYPFYIIRPERPDGIALSQERINPFVGSTNNIQKDFIAPDIRVVSGTTNDPTALYTHRFSESLYEDAGAGFQLFSNATGIVNHTVGSDSRLVDYNWYQHDSPSSSPYQNNPGNTTDSNHGTHVASIACGNSQGLASEANIYNITPLDFERTSNAFFDFIRDFHINKPINPETNRQNPTVVNNSWNFNALTTDVSDLTGIVCSGFPKYSGDGFNLIGAENPGITGTLDLEISGKVNAVSHIKGIFDNMRVLIGGEFTGVTLNGTGFDVRNLCAIDLYGNTMLKEPVSSDINSLYFGMGVNGPVETILTDLTAARFTDHPYNHPSQGTILVGGEFTKKYDDDFNETTVKNIIRFDTTQTLENSIIADSTFITKPLFTSLNGKVKKITKVIGNRGYGAKYCFLGDFTEFNSSPQENLLVTNTGFDKTGFLGENSFDPPPIIGTVNDFGVPQNRLNATNDLEHSMVIGGNFSEVGGQPFNNICALDSTGGLISEFNQNFNGTNGEINAIIDGGFSLTTYNYIALGNFTSGNSPGDQYASRYNFRTAIGVIPGVQDQMDDFTIDGVVTKAVRDPIDHKLIHLFGSFSRVQGTYINNLATSSYCTLEDISYTKDHFPPRDYGVDKDQRRLEPILNQRTLTGAGNVEAAMTTNLDATSHIKSKNTVSLGSVQRTAREGLTLLGENLPGHSNSMIHLTTNFCQSEKEIANNFGAIDGFNRYTKAAIVSSVTSDMEDAIEDGIIFINSAGNDNRLMVPSDHPNFAQIKGLMPFINYTAFLDVPSNYMINSAGTPQTKGINVGSLSVNVEETGFVNRSTFSNYGPQVHVYAPGEEILGAVNGTTNFNPFNNDRSSYDKFDGTSMASPNVCGLVALYLSKYPDLNQEEILNTLQRKSETGKMFGPTGDPAGSNLNVPLNNINLYDSYNIIPKYWDFRELESFYKVMHPQTVSPAIASSGIVYPKIKNKFYN